MADLRFSGGPSSGNVSEESSGNVSEESSDLTVELKIKTLDSRIYSFQVEKNMPVLAFKEKIASEIDVPVGQQRLIFRGKVLKDGHLLSEYQVESGDTLHLVARQPAQLQPSSATGPGETSGNNSSRGNDASSGASRNRVGQISHSVVLGTFNVGDQSEGIVPDLTRVIGAVLNSFGIGGQMTSNNISGAQSSISPNAPGQAPPVNETEGMQGNQVQSGQAFPSQPFQSLPQVVQIPAAALPVPSLNAPIPHSLNTLSEFINRMEQTLSQNGYQPDQSSSNTGDLPSVELPSDARGLPTPEALSIVLRRAQRLLSSHSIAALSHIAGRLEQEGTSSDPTIRGQIQTEAAQIGLAMQHLGSLLLELGRTILTLRMGQSPAEYFVNAGPAVYISPSGPNPIMVQPFPLQTNSLFGGSAVPSNPVTSAPVGIGNAPRHINIHIHAGTSLAPIVSAVGTGSGDSASTRGLPARNIIASTVPLRPPGAASSSVGQSGPGVSISQPPDAISLSPLIAEINSQLRNFVGNMQGPTQVSSDQVESTVQNLSVGSGAANEVGNEQLNGMAVNESGESHLPLHGFASGSGQKPQTECNQAGCSTSCSSNEPTLKPENASENALRSGEKPDNSKGTKAVPLGLGLGSLERKRPGGQPKSLVRSGDVETSTVNQNQPTRTSGQRLWQSLASRSSSVNRPDSSAPPAGQLANLVGQTMESSSIGREGSGGQFDAASVMSQVLQTPALDGLLAGVSEHTGVGSPDVLRNMLQQFTQSPAMRNTVNQIAQQVENQDIGNMFSGLGRGQGGGVDLSRMVQQMMPIVSRALSGAAGPPQPFPDISPEPQPPHNETISRDDKHNNQNFQIDLEQVAQSIENLDPPGDVFRSVVENAVHLYGDGNGPEGLVDELCNDEGLANEYIEMLCHDAIRRFQDPGQDKC